ncbi:major facilitator superfamily domain-containing protein [Aspergillus pseudoustus]|uniref:Major facilitator superfamily domain-containing protein n=1 Tax=Aspergillus pseudoustus TaxID=1810923 RepID=A0ABR4KYC1_9EURO
MEERLEDQEPRATSTDRLIRTHESSQGHSEKEPDQPRPEIAPWKWRGSLFSSVLTALIHGYNSSNVANIQPHLYEAFGNIELLPWISLSYTLSVFAVLSLSRKVIYCFDLRWINIVFLAIFISGAAIGGSASSMSVVVVGRIIMGIGGAVVYQTNLTFISVYTSPAHIQRLIGALSGAWAVGFIIGGPIGAAVAENSRTSWRWVFYLNLPWMGLALLISILCFPLTYLGPDILLTSRLLQADPLGIALNMATPVLFSVALEFSGPVWAWNSSGPAITVWVLFSVMLAAWILQQAFCVGTTPEQRAIPVHLLPRLNLVPLWIASGCVAVAYAITLYFIPLFFAFARGLDPMQQTVYTLPFILTFITAVVLVGAVLPLVGRHYYLFYIFASAATTSAAAGLAAILDASTPDSQIMGLAAVIGLGLGASFQHGVGISNTQTKTTRDRVDSATLLLLAQMGTIAISLPIAGCILQNMGEAKLADALRGIPGLELSREEVLQTLAGASSVLSGAGGEGLSAEQLARAVDAVTRVLARDFWLVVAEGVACFLCGVGMWIGWKGEAEGGKEEKKEGV